jgi:hypothetical protein
MVTGKFGPLPYGGNQKDSVLAEVFDIFIQTTYNLQSFEMRGPVILKSDLFVSLTS